MAMQEAGQRGAAALGRYGRRAASLRRPVARRARRIAGAASDFDAGTLATGLGWLGIGLGLAELVAPGALARLIGAADDEKTRRALQACGVREIAAGIGILAQPRSAGWMWSRVAGDVMDLGLLGAAFTSRDAQKDRLAAAAAAVVGVAVLDLVCGERLRQESGEEPGHRAEEHGIHVREAITVNRPAEELYRFWRDFENLPRFMAHLESVRQVGDGRSRWRAAAPLGSSVEWEAELTEDQPNHRLAWRSLPGGDVDNEGSVSFEPHAGGRGTVVRVELSYRPPGGAVGAAVAKLFGRAPDQELHDDLRRFKQVMELGEVVQSDATAKGGAAAAPRA